MFYFTDDLSFRASDNFEKYREKSSPLGHSLSISIPKVALSCVLIDLVIRG